MEIRLDKFVSKAASLTRSEAKKAIRAGRVAIGDKEGLEFSCEKKVSTDEDIFLDGEVICYERYVYFMLNKPKGYISATEDKKDKLVVDLIKEYRAGDLFPVGRLDKDTEGLLILTNDGQFAHDLLSPKKHVDKVYEVHIEGKLSKEDIEILESGIDIGEEKPCLPAKVELSDREYVDSCERNLSVIFLTISEGKYHQVKRMLGKLGKPVRYLKRLRMGKYVLDERLEPGEYKRLDI